MQLIIDIPKDAYDYIMGSGYFPSNFNMISEIRNGIPLDKIRSEILEEKEWAYADFDEYKVDYLGVDSRYVEDELPYDDFRYGMERCIEIIDKYKKGAIRNEHR